MMNLMTALYQHISESHDYETYRTQAPQEVELPNGKKIPTPFPYVVFKLMPISNTESDRDDYTLEISCWDKNEGTSDAKVLEIAESIRKDLISWIYIDDNILLFMDRPSLGNVPDADSMIKRYDVTTILKTYRR